MTSLLLRIAIAGFLALASLTVILFRVSPLSAPGLAVPFFLLTVFLCQQNSRNDVMAQRIALLEFELKELKKK